MGFQRIEGGWRFIFGGMKTNAAADELTPVKYPFAKNVRMVKSLQTRPGYVELFDTNPPAGCSSLLITLEAATSPTAAWDCLVYAPEIPLLLTIGNTGITERSATSTDGVAWTGHTIGSFGGFTFTSLAWSPTLALFIGVGVPNGTGAGIKSSTDGATWTTRDTTDYDWAAVCWSVDQSKFVAVGFDNNGASLPVYGTSSDGLTWVTGNLPGTFLNNPLAVLWVAALSKYITVGSDFSGGSQPVWTSPDGSTWTLQTTPANDNLWTALAYSPSLALIVAVGSSGTGTDNRTMHSVDGITWVLGTVPASTSGNGDYTSIVWSVSLGLFIASGRDDGTGTHHGCFSHSSDGITFTLDTVPTNYFGPISLVSFETSSAVVSTGNLADSSGAQALIICADA